MKIIMANCVWAILLTLFLAGCGGGDGAVPASINAPTEGKTAEAGSVQPVTLSATPSNGDAAESPAAHKGAELYPEVMVKTSLGDFTIQLDAEKAPVTVDNFLRNYVDREFYDNTIFHYVEDGYIASAGGYTPEGEAKSTRTEIRNEAHNGLKNVRGTVAMARHPKYVNSATSQFWVNLVDNPFFDHQPGENAETAEYGYCVFGKITSGLDVIDRISKTPVHDTDEFAQLPVKPVVILSIRRTK